MLAHCFGEVEDFLHGDIYWAHYVGRQVGKVLLQTLLNIFEPARRDHEIAQYIQQ